MSSIDDLIRKRLDKLKENTSLQPSGSVSRPITEKAKKTAAEQVESLLAELSEETTLDSKVLKGGTEIDNQIKSRLERLKSREGCNFESTNQSSKQNVNSEGIEDHNFFKTSSCLELLAEIKNDHSKDSTSSEDSDVSENLCVVCDEKKPALICLGCDKDCYCYKCFKEFHSDDDDHSTVPFVQKKHKKNG